MATKSKEVKNAPLMEMIKAAIKSGVILPPPTPLVPFTEREALTLVSEIITSGVRTHTYSYDPFQGTVAFSLPNPLDWFVELETGEPLYVFLRRHLEDVEGWDSITFINPRTGVGNGRLIMTKKTLVGL